MAVGDVSSEEVGTAARYNDGKADYSLVPIVALEDCAKVFDYGRKKYKEWNWLKGQQWSHPYASLMRHLSAWQQGEDIDPESGLPHLGHAMCNMVMLSTFAKTYPEGDNRPNKKYFNKEVTPIEPRNKVTDDKFGGGYPGVSGVKAVSREEFDRIVQQAGRLMEDRGAHYLSAGQGPSTQTGD